MITCVFTIDYEIYGNGEGSLMELVFEPAEKLRTLFSKENCRFVAFIEAAELEMIEAKKSDPAIGIVRDQIHSLHRDGFEIGLHIHPQWYNAQYQDGKWNLDYDEYNLCTLPEERIVEIVDRSLRYLRTILKDPEFTPLSFRAGNWLFQPTRNLARVLAEEGIKLDSSVFKGGLQRRYGLDYRRAPRDEFYWSFSSRVDVPDSKGFLLEIPTYTKMVPFWRMFTRKRIGIKRRLPALDSPASRFSEISLNRISDFLRPSYPLKLDFCRMTLGELISMVETVVSEDQKEPGRFRPVVAIGHTKDLVDYKTVESFLSYLRAKQIPVATFNDVYPRCWD